MRADTVSFFKRSHASVSVGLIVAISIGFLLAYVKAIPLSQVAFVPTDALSKPWTLLTYAFADVSFISHLFICLWIYSVGGIVEVDLGKVKYGLFWLGFTILSSLSIWLGSAVTSTVVPLISAHVPLTAFIVLWGTRYADSPASLLFIPMKAKWLALIAVGIVFFAMPPTLALFSLIPISLAFAIAMNFIPFIPYSKITFSSTSPTKTYKKHFKEGEEFYFDADKRRIEREERDRLRKLFESSVSDDEK